MRVSRVVAAVCLFAVAALSFMQGYAAWAASRDPALAARLDPLNAAYAEAAGHPERAVELNPRHSAGWVQLGLAAEQSREMDAAERYLLRATKVSARWLPRWTVANFYLRRGRLDRFWQEASVAVNIPRRDVSPVLSLAYRVEANGAEVFRRLQPRHRHALAMFVAHACAIGDLQGMEASALPLATQAANSDRGLIYEATERLLEGGRTTAALRVWNAFGETRAATGAVTNPTLAPGSGRGFDWRIHVRPGVRFHAAAAGSEAELELTGEPLTPGPVLEQWLALPPNKAYSVRVEYGESDLNESTGFTWRLDAPRSRIELVYTPPAGVPRARGTLQIRRVMLQPES